jgi:hypothetical protein
MGALTDVTSTTRGELGQIEAQGSGHSSQPDCFSMFSVKTSTDELAITAMKRSSALAPLSRDHHHALVVAAQLRRVTPFTAEPARDAFLRYWRDEGGQHFREEEEILLPAYGRHANPHHPLIVRVLCEHVAIRALAAIVGEPAPPIAILQDLGLALSDHVRLEERSLLPLIEQTVPAAQLERLASELSQSQV